MWSATVGATPVYRWTCAASAIFSYGSRGTPAWANTLNRVPELPNAHDGSSIRWPRSVSVTPVPGWARVCMPRASEGCVAGIIPRLSFGFKRLPGISVLAEHRSVRRAAAADVVYRARRERDLVRGEPRDQGRELGRLPQASHGDEAGH